MATTNFRTGSAGCSAPRGRAGPARHPVAAGLVGGNGRAWRGAPLFVEANDARRPPTRSQAASTGAAPGQPHGQLVVVRCDTPDRVPTGNTPSGSDPCQCGRIGPGNERRRHEQPLAARGLEDRTTRCPATGSAVTIDVGNRQLFYLLTQPTVSKGAIPHGTRRSRARTQSDSQGRRWCPNLRHEDPLLLASDCPVYCLCRHQKATNQDLTHHTLITNFWEASVRVAQGRYSG